MVRYLKIILYYGFLVVPFFSLVGQDGVLPPGDLIQSRIDIPGNIIMGVKLGANLSGILVTHDPKDTYTQSPETEPVPGMNVSFGAEILINQEISLFADLQYINFITKYRIATGKYHDVFEENNRMVSIPAGIYYHLGNSGVKYYPLAGLAINYLFLSDLDYQYHPFPDDSPYVQTGKINNTFDKNRIHFDGIIGLGFRYQFRAYFFSLELTYRHGLRNYKNTTELKTMQIYSGLDPPFSYQSPGYRTHLLMVNLLIQKPGIR